MRMSLHRDGQIPVHIVLVKVLERTISQIRERKAYIVWLGSSVALNSEEGRKTPVCPPGGEDQRHSALLTKMTVIEVCHSTRRVVLPNGIGSLRKRLIPMWAWLEWKVYVSRGRRRCV